ncbi:hypothetical protein L208DRAFT_1284713 [Tricholoma matsutake]|nr:hypothetical protein L208DRAFT_1301735 [Tricholoma matsutake 945]KAF8229770.1 hypothetical protein L208DRAFT_1284713 [Tricholoma matsutake 945]
MSSHRYHTVSPFGQSTICHFCQNVSDLKQLAARDFEDLLQCALPCFEGLIHPPYNAIVLDMLFIIALWHGFGKMKIHTDISAQIF